MTREIKFRVWDPSSKRMIKPSFDLVIEFHTNPFGEAYTCAFVDNKKIDNAIIMQFTGLRLTNGQEVYENDIVKDEDGIIGLIEFDDYDNNACHYRILYYPIAKYQTYSKEICLINPDESDVLGNRYENPEILEGL